MALFPQGLTHVDARCNPGERRVLQAIKRCLGDDVLVWHDTPIGPRARQPDFVLLSPHRGLLLLEVKDWKYTTLRDADRDRVVLETPRGRVTVAHPLRQARDIGLELVDQMQRDPALVATEGRYAGKLRFPFGFGIVMAGILEAQITDRDGFDAIFPPSRTLLRDALENAMPPAAFEERLWAMFTVQFPHTLALPQRDRIRWHLFPEVRLGRQAALGFDEDAAATSTTPPPLPDLMQVMDLQQEQVARTLGEGHRVIHGAAGSGKTMILVFRAEQLAAAAQPEKPILVLCFNRALAGRIDAMLRERGCDERVVVRTFHGWCDDLVRTYALDGTAGHRRTSADFAGLAATVERAVAAGRVPGGQYTALLIDEAHDFEDDWLRIAARMVEPTSRSLLVMYDDAQAIYGEKRRRSFSFQSVGIEARGRTSILRINYRNTAEVLALAVQCAGAWAADTEGAPKPTDDAIPRVEPTTAGRRGPLPVLIEASSESVELGQIAERVASLIAGGVPSGEIAVIARYRAILDEAGRALAARGVASRMLGQSRRPAGPNANAAPVALVTLHACKGLEFRHVYVAGLQTLPREGETPDDALRLLYVAMTRSTEALTLSSHGRRSIATSRVRAALDTIARRFAAIADAT